jgi:hypothetical protein
MSGKVKRDLEHVDIPRLMEVICGFRKERYPFERYVALMTFSVWLVIPKEEDCVRRAQLISAASVILTIENEKLELRSSKKRSVIEQIAKPLFQTVEVADALVNRFEINPDAVIDATFITAFIFRCPKELNPSVNKALFYMKNGGVTEDLNDAGDDTPAKLSPATLKDRWGSCAASSPFAYAALLRKSTDAIPSGSVERDELLNLPTIIDLEIDEEDGVLEAGRILQDVSRLRRFFGTARYIQNILLERLHESSVQKIPFVEFPETIQPHVIEPRPFSPTQLKIIKSYRAPRFSRFDPVGHEDLGLGKPYISWPRKFWRVFDFLRSAHLAGVFSKDTCRASPPTASHPPTGPTPGGRDSELRGLVPRRQAQLEGSPVLRPGHR